MPGGLERLCIQWEAMAAALKNEAAVWAEEKGRCSGMQFSALMAAEALEVHILTLRRSWKNATATALDW